MRRISLASVSVLAAAFLAGPASATILVLGSSPGRPCYESALSRDISPGALRECDEALASGLMHSRDMVATYVNRGVIKLYAGGNAAAIADFDSAIALDPGEPEAYLNKGSALLKMGAGTNQAIALFDEALRRDTRRPELAFFGRAIAHEVSGDVKAAYMDYRRARQAAPKWEEPQRELARFTVTRTGG